MVVEDRPHLFLFSLSLSRSLFYLNPSSCFFFFLFLLLTPRNESERRLTLINPVHQNDL